MEVKNDEIQSKKRDAFLQEIRNIIRESLQEAAPADLSPLLRLLQSTATSSAPKEPEDSADMDAALDFADSF